MQVPRGNALGENAMIGATKSICKIGERTITDKPSCDGHLPVSEIERKHVL